MAYLNGRIIKGRVTVSKVLIWLPIITTGVSAGFKFSSPLMLKIPPQSSIKLNIARDEFYQSSLDSLFARALGQERNTTSRNRVT